MATPPIVTIAVPSYNQGRFLQDALTSIFDQDLPVEVFVADAGSTDGSIDVIKTFESRLAGWRSHAIAVRPRPSTKVSPREPLPMSAGSIATTRCSAAD